MVMMLCEETQDRVENKDYKESSSYASVVNVSKLYAAFCPDSRMHASTCPKHMGFRR